MMGANVRGLREAIAAATGMRLAERPDGTDGARLRWSAATGALFVKLADAADLGAFEAEAAGLVELAAANAIRVPIVLGTGVHDDGAFIALEWLDLKPPTSECEARLGTALAMQHRVSASTFGWHRDNNLGRSPQDNSPDDDWPRFFATRRLAPQLAAAARSGAGRELIDSGLELCSLVDLLFTSYRPVPCLLHGDLWAGNRGAVGSDPVVFDPAVYYGDRETDLAMTFLFGGFGPSFYAAYQSAWPLDQAAGTRRTLYNLYHVLNHWNLFGGGYAGQALAMTRRLLAEIGH
jgi:protein-ribulosamine 3-kinase